MQKRHRRWLFAMACLLIGANIWLQLSGTNSPNPYQVWGVLIGLTLLILSLVKYPSWAARLTLILLIMMVNVTLLEGMLRLHSIVQSGNTDTIHLIDDDELIWRVRPGTMETDANGWRNAQIPDVVDIVALGDSQTWGFNARIDESWPAVLAAQSGRSVYNMGLAGYGTLDYMTLFEEALAMQPETVIVGLYSGNDFYNAVNRVYTKAAFETWRQSDTTQRHDDLAALDARIKAEEDRLTAIENPSSGVALFLKKTEIGTQLTSFYDRIRPVSPEFFQTEWTDSHTYAFYHTDNQIYYLTPAYRLHALNTDERLIREGIDLSYRALLEMQQMAAENDVQLLVVLIPTKELVYMDSVSAPDWHIFHDLIAAETAIWEEVRVWLQAQNIVYVDTLPALNASADRSIYPTNTDGHPLPEGYRIIASVVAEKLAGSP
ncbi:MAG: GDSL-type esterase/lipase family protein [Aggregatilineales bacterium]